MSVNCKIGQSMRVTLIVSLLPRNRLSIVALTNEDFLRQPPQMYRRTSFRIEMLQKSGFHVLPLNMTDLEEMPKRELIPFLMREITDAIKEQK